ncbi:unnamed protein product [Parascedosporium putredinis]|uniref:Uncharacterized protein n=1 Tax=Parascedosporium putredinis TaxID=1442378 RepID=A0A9P1MA44_9PEZI|nr:unnamed protein product [Parascedosporium putredinis]CAI7993367.1 unnamed protein product [Parascedosporium putredinis]
MVAAVPLLNFTWDKFVSTDYAIAGILLNSFTKLNATVAGGYAPQESSVHEDGLEIPELVEVKLDFKGCPLDLNLGDNYDRQVARDCALACRNATDLFSSFSLYNCAVLATSAMLVQNGSLEARYVDMKPYQAELHFGPLVDFDWPVVLESMARCTAATCASGDYGECQYEKYYDESFLDRSWASISAREGLQTMGLLLEEFDWLCTSRSEMLEDSEADDIGGPGVLAGYFIQISIAIIFFTVANLLTYWTRLPDFLISTLSKNPRKKPSTASPSSRVAAALFTSLADFQEAQSFFMIAIQLATLIIYGPTWAPDKFISARSSAFFATTHVLLVLMIQSSLQRLGTRWWYTFASPSPSISSASSSTRATSPAMPSTPYPNDTSIPSIYGRRLARQCIAVSHLFISVLILDELAHSRLLEGLRRKFNVTEKYPIVAVILHLRWAMLDLIMVVFLLRYIISIDYSIGMTFTTKDAWDYGQIIAVVIWVPVFARWAYSTLFGVEESVGRRISPNYVVFRRTEGVKARSR